MPKFRVTIERKLYQSAAVIVSAPTSERAQAKVDSMILHRKLKPETLEWDHPEPENDEIVTTGDVEYD